MLNFMPPPPDKKKKKGGGGDDDEDAVEADVSLYTLLQKKRNFSEVAFLLGRSVGQ